MTNEQLDNLNIKIAKKLGWQNFRMEHTPEPLDTRRMCGVAPGNIRRQFVPHFTSNLAYALKLVDWANEKGYDFDLVKDAKWGSHYRAYFSNDVRNIMMFEGKGTLPSMAIVKAFLKIK